MFMTLFQSQKQRIGLCPASQYPVPRHRYLKPSGQLSETNPALDGFTGSAL